MKALIERIKKSNEFLNAFTSHNVLDAEATDNVRRCVIKNELAIADYEKIVNGASTSDEALPIADHEERAAEKYPDKSDKWEIAKVKIQGAAYIEGLKDSEKWVSVEDELPDIGVRVWCYSISDGQVEDQYEGMVCGKYWFEGTREENRTDITHWQPLPQPPKT